MLKIRCFERFDWSYSQLVISGNEHAYRQAYLFFREQVVSHLAKPHTTTLEDLKVRFILNDPTICIYYPTPFVPDILEMTLGEAIGIVLYFGLLSEGGKGHYYHDIEILPDIELRISLNEYDDQMFEEE